MFGDDNDAVVDLVDLEQGLMTLQLVVEDHHIGTAGTLDEGLVATLADNYTTYLMISHSLALHPDTMPISVSACLSAHAFAPITPGTAIAIVCKVANPALPKPHASAVFHDAADSRIVYAVASHTKHYKDVMGYGSDSPAKL
ncbi:hypothetical protein GGI04_005454 [Coemansia thaxteri]|uniref:Uncharacterized protein n=1 Tax=Coemansia thaxteri TaxID=2663907 RepID=A0A9W8BH96_9FUNG|nr:hypothetical protein GGI04_005454 [Coemansia thaxteri]KAJ2008378.1 hypothetical protein H4R26_000234 [Coemansia thaxteri]KAJ2338458.1 hypothetical protein GGH92_007162 [Coemansia sp. RSA 2673]KAJ2469658.1 hypothetical protein GGI02_003342 [Coemansia sp. RSA 2322]KAJ2487607.1 hypothetical protein EV174_000435 [Coemansia sp. RSA 2320]